jgi:hypothetical protein
MKADRENRAGSSWKTAIHGFRSELDRELYRSSGDAIEVARKGSIKFGSKFRTKVGGWIGGLAVLAVLPANAGEALEEWHWRHPLPAGHALRSIVHDGQQFVAVGNNTLLTSLDGKEWITRTSTDFEGLEAIAAGGGRRVGVGAGGRILVSESGSDWELVQSGRSIAWKQVQYLENAFVAVGENGNLAVSPDGYNWTDHRPETFRGLNGVAYGESIYVSVGEHLTLLRSSDGRNWTTRIPISGSANLRAAAFGAGLFVAVGEQGTILRSEDGMYWERGVSPTSATLASVRYLGNVFFAADEAGALLRSVDGLNWSAVTTEWTGALSDVAYDGTRFVAVGPDVTVLTSADGEIWEQEGSVARSQLNGVAYGDDRFVAVGHDGLVLTSENGGTWTMGTSGTTNRLSDVAYGGGQFVAVGHSGTVLTSRDGRAWDRPAMPGVGWVRGIDFGNGRFVGVTFPGEAVSSDDGVDWVGTLVARNIQLYDIAFGEAGSVFVAVGPLHLFRSPDGIEWVPIPKTFDERLNGIASGTGGFLAVGDEGGVYVSADGMDWQRRGTVPTQPFAIVTIGDRYLVVGREGLFSSVDGSDWVPHETGTFRLYQGAAYGADTVVVVGEKATILQSAPLTGRPLELTAMGWSAGTGFTLAVSGTAGDLVRIEAAEELGQWRVLEEVTLVGESTRFTDASAGGAARRYYRASRHSELVNGRVNRE